MTGFTMYPNARSIAEEQPNLSNLAGLIHKYTKNITTSISQISSVHVYNDTGKSGLVYTYLLIINCNIHSQHIELHQGLDRKLLIAYLRSSPVWFTSYPCIRNCTCNTFGFLFYHQIHADQSVPDEQVYFKLFLIIVSLFRNRSYYVTTHSNSLFQTYRIHIRPQQFVEE